MRKILNTEDFTLGESYWRAKKGTMENGEKHSPEVVVLRERSGRKCFQPNSWWLDDSTLDEFDFIGPIVNPFSEEVVENTDAETLSNSEYLAKEGNVCPFCRCSEVESNGTVEVDGSIAWQKVTCTECDESWQDNYNLVGFQ